MLIFKLIKLESGFLYTFFSIVQNPSLDNLRVTALPYQKLAFLTKCSLYYEENFLVVQVMEDLFTILI
jgi:hypothetical protein